MIPNYGCKTHVVFPGSSNGTKLFLPPGKVTIVARGWAKIGGFFSQAGKNSFMNDCARWAGPDGLKNCRITPFGHPFLGLFIDYFPNCLPNMRCGQLIGSELEIENGKMGRYAWLRVATVPVPNAHSDGAFNVQICSEGFETIYYLASTGHCEDPKAYIITKEECQVAATDLGLSDVKAHGAGSYQSRPIGCYFKSDTGQLVFNRGGSLTNMDVLRPSLCRKGEEGYRFHNLWSVTKQNPNMSPDMVMNVGVVTYTESTEFPEHIDVRRLQSINITWIQGPAQEGVMKIEFFCIHQISMGYIWFSSASMESSSDLMIYNKRTGKMYGVYEWMGFRFIFMGFSWSNVMGTRSHLMFTLAKVSEQNAMPENQLIDYESTGVRDCACKEKEYPKHSLPGTLMCNFGKQKVFKKHCAAKVFYPNGCPLNAQLCKRPQVLPGKKKLMKAHDAATPSGLPLNEATPASSSGSHALLITVIGFSLFLLSLFYYCARRKRNSGAIFEDVQLLDEA